MNALLALKAMMIGLIRLRILIYVFYLLSIGFIDILVWCVKV